MGDEKRGARDNPGVVAPPPLIYAGALTAGLLVNRRYRIPFLPRPLARTLGPSLVACGLAVGLLGMREMRRAETNVDPYKPSTAVVTEGPYRFTHNPLYLSMILVYGGVSALANALPPVLLLPPTIQRQSNSFVGCGGLHPMASCRRERQRKKEA